MKVLFTLLGGSEWGYFDNTKHLFFLLYNIKQLIFSHFNTNIKKFVVTLSFPHKQTNHTLKGEIFILGLCLLSQRGFFGHFPTIRDYFKTSEEWGRYPVTLFPSSWSQAFFAFMERDFLISFLPRGAFLIWEPIMADRQVKLWLWRIQAFPLADDCTISCSN